MFPILDNDAFTAITDIMETYWKDNNRSRVLLPSGTYTTVEKNPEEPAFNAQSYFLEKHSEKK